MHQHFAARSNAKTVAIQAIRGRQYKAWLKKQPKLVQNWMTGRRFKGKPGSWTLVPARDGSLSMVVLVLPQSPSLWTWAGLPTKLPLGRYRIEADLDEHEATDAALGWAMGTYHFGRYTKDPHTRATLVWPAGADRHYVQHVAEAVQLGRDLINTPAGDLGPEQLARAVEELAMRHDAEYAEIVGDELLEQNYPAVHAVGRAAAQPPRLADLRWGDESHPRLTLVGKGVCFDSGGLDLKSASGMKLMKKDMGGAASVLALAHLIMASELPVRLRVLIPAVENAVSGNAFRPLDVLRSRKGITIEVGNTDAEGRLILCDALAEAVSESPDLLIDFATLTGAARVALGTELPALFANDDAVAHAVLDAGLETDDPLWRLPLWDPYRRHLDSKVADINNISSVAQGGAITAALFLREFVGKHTWCHVDTMGWNSQVRPGRPVGGDVFGIRAFHAMLTDRYAVAPTEG